MRRTAIFLSPVLFTLLAGGGFLACSAFGGADANPSPGASDAGKQPDTGTQTGPMLDGAVVGEMMDGSTAKDAGSDGGSTNPCVAGQLTLFSMQNCSSPPTVDSDAGSEAPNASKPSGASGVSCNFQVSAGGFATFTRVFPAQIIGPTTLDFAINPQTLPNATAFGCSVKTQVGNDSAEAFIRAVPALGQQVAFHLVQPPTVDATNAFALPVTLPLNNSWSSVSMTINPGGTLWPVTVETSSANTTTKYGPYVAPGGMGQITLTCGVTVPDATMVVFVDSITLRTACQ